MDIRTTWFSAFAVASALLSGCTVLLEAPEQCSVDADCVGRDFGEDVLCVDHVCTSEGTGGGTSDGADWSCAGKSPPDPDPGMTTYRAMLTDVTTRQPLTQLPVKACNDLDPECLHPLSEVLTGDDGRLEIELPNDFEGFLDIQSETTLPGVIDFVTPFTRIASEGDGDSIALFGADNLELLGKLAGISIDLELGHVNLRVEDCSAVRAPGVSLRVNPVTRETTVSYLEGGLPSDRDSTDAKGQAFIGNAPGGFVTLSPSVLAEPLNLKEQTVFVREGAVTYTMIPAN